VPDHYHAELLKCSFFVRFAGFACVDEAKKGGETRDDSLSICLVSTYGTPHNIIPLLLSP
jgi:hypothetical protein